MPEILIREEALKPSGVSLEGASRLARKGTLKNIYFYSLG